MKFRKKPVVIEAVQFTRIFDWPDWFRDAVSEDRIRVYNTGMFHNPNSECWAGIATLEGDMTANENDWIIRGIKGELYPCKPDIFEMTYEVAE
jgi:hypothetical protein